MRKVNPTKFVLQFFVLLIVCLLSVLAHAQTEELVSQLPSAPILRNYGELYSENNLYTKDVLTTDTRLRQYFSLLSKSPSDVTFDIEAFVGASWQAQFLDSATQYLTDAVSPAAGLRANWQQWVYLTFEERYRFEYQNENTKNQSDPRLVLSGGQFLPWLNNQAQYLFTEFYGEASWVYRIDPAPVSTLWVKQGYRIPVAAKLYADPYVEFYARQSSNPDLGASLNEGRAGGRLAYSLAKFSLAAHLYLPFASENRDKLAGLFVVGGLF
jgi:hypothetical protein